jgi:hypothetical protein
MWNRIVPLLKYTAFHSSPIIILSIQVLLGVVRNLLFSIINSQEKCTKAQLMVMCHDLEATLTPHSFKRRPRSLLELVHWKAHELKHFLLYYGPVVLRSLSEEFHIHFLMLSVAIRLLLRDTVSDTDIAAASELLNAFMLRTPQLYGDVSQTHNHHLLKHLPDQVRYLLFLF